MKTVTIIGAGIGGLSAAYALENEAKKTNVGLKINLIEKKGRIGGNIFTQNINGFLVEGGPDCVFSEKPEALRLCESIGLNENLLRTNDHKKGTFVYWKNRLHDLPEGIMLMIPTMIKPMLYSSLISLPGKLRVGLEPFIPKRTKLEEESLSEFVKRRFGKELLDKIAEPLVAGIHAGNAETMSINASFPRFVELEQNYGSLIRGMLTRKKKMAHIVKNKPKKFTMFMTLKDGLQNLVYTIESKLEKTEIKLNCETLSIVKEVPHYIVSTENGDKIKSDSVIIATPAYNAASILNGMASQLSGKLSEIPYTSTATVNLAFSLSSLNKIPSGFGVIVPKISNRKIRAITITSNKFSYRSPSDSILMRIFVGGPNNEKLVEMDDKEMISMVCNELSHVLSINAKPLFGTVNRWEKAWPQYSIGHIDRIKRIKELAKDYPGIYVTGSAYNGIGISDCISNSNSVAKDVINYIDSI